MTLKRLKRMVGYKGAGIVFIAPDTEGQTRVLLGQRSFRPYAGYWSLPGGGMEEGDNGSFRACAAREAFEETVGVPKLKDIERLFVQRVAAAPEHRVRLPLCFDYRSYILPLRSMPDARLWPNAQAWGSEFRQFAWFHPRWLPRPLHPYVAETLDALIPYREH